MAAGRQSTTALDRRGVRRTPSQSQSLDLGNSSEETGKQGHLGMSSELAAWWGEAGGAGGMGEDPLQGCLGREQQARAVYKRYAAAASASHLKHIFVHVHVLIMCGFSLLWEN